MALSVTIDSANDHIQYKTKQYRLSGLENNVDYGAQSHNAFCETLVINFFEDCSILTGWISRFPLR